MKRISFLLLLLVSHVAHAHTVAIDDAQGTCPSRDQVFSSLRKLHPEVRLVERDGDVSVTLVDLGDRYRVSLATDRVFDDPGRRCDERARATALVVALAVDELPPPPAPPPPAPRPVRTRPPRDIGPQALIERGLVLPSQTMMFTAALHVGVLDDGGWDVGSVLLTDFRVGTPAKVDLGFWVANPLRRDTSEASAVPYVILGLHRDVALRMEVGYERARVPNPDVPNALEIVDGLYTALTLVTRARIHRMVTLTFGDPGLFTQRPTDSHGQYSNLTTVTSHALFALEIKSQLYMSTCLPIGILFQPHPTFAMHLAAGPRLVFNDRTILTGLMAVPVWLDLVVTPHPRVDLGLSIDLPLFFGAPSSSVQASALLRVRI